MIVVEVFPLAGSGDPLRNHVMFIGGVPLTILQSIMTSNPIWTYTGVPILTVLLPFGTTDGLGINDPLSMTGGTIKIEQLQSCNLVYCNLRSYHIHNDYWMNFAKTLWTVGHYWN